MADEDWLDELPEIQTYGMYTSTFKPVKSSDPFMQDFSEVKTLNGTTPAFKRKMGREMQKFQRGQDGAETKRIEEEVVSAYNAFDVVLPPYNLEWLAKLYELSPPHYASVNAKVSNIVGLGYKLVETRKTKRRIEELEGDEERVQSIRKKLLRVHDGLEHLLESFNEEDTLTEVLVKVWRDYETTGNGYLEVGRKRDGTIGYLGHVPSITMRIRKQRDGFAQIIGKDTVFFRNFGDTTTTNPFGNDSKPNEVIHIKKYSPTSTYYGVPDVISAITAITGNDFAAKYNLDYFENKAIPRYAIISKGVKFGSQVQNALLGFFETNLRGQNHRSIYIPLPEDTEKSKKDIKFEAIESGAQDASFKEYKKQNLNEILMSHRVPISKIGLAEGVSLAVARDADKTFKEQVCAPEQRIFEKKFNKILVDLGVDSFEFKLNEMTLTDADTQSKIDERMVKAGIWVPNEPRIRDGLPALPDGDERVDLNAKDKIAEAQANMRTQRERDSARSAGATDSAGEARNPQGEGRTTP